MEFSVDEARSQYLALLESHVSQEMQLACPQVMDLLRSNLAMDIFAPKEWRGMSINPVDMKCDANMTLRHKVKDFAVIIETSMNLLKFPPDLFRYRTMSL